MRFTTLIASSLLVLVLIAFVQQTSALECYDCVGKGKCEKTTKCTAGLTTCQKTAGKGLDMKVGLRRNKNIFCRKTNYWELFSVALLRTGATWLSNSSGRYELRKFFFWSNICHNFNLRNFVLFLVLQCG